MRGFIIALAASLALFAGQAHAQRCLPKMQGIEVRANMTDGFKVGGNDGGYSFGAALSTYTKKGHKWVSFSKVGIYHSKVTYLYTVNRHIAPVNGPLL